VAFYTGECVDSMVMSFVSFEVGKVRRFFVTWRVTTPNPSVPAIRTAQTTKESKRKGLKRNRNGD
jgi:hypothetical protein